MIRAALNTSRGVVLEFGIQRFIQFIGRRNPEEVGPGERTVYGERPPLSE
jgi:hypothetical protein